MTCSRRAVRPVSKMGSQRAVPPVSKMGSQPALARASKTWLAMGAFALIIAGCEEKSKPMPRGLIGADGRPLVARQTASRPPQSSAPAPAAKFKPLPSPFAPVPARDPGALQAPAQATPPPVQAQRPPRDLSSELARLIPAPADCFDLARASTQGKIEISVSATVSPSGRLTSVLVTAPGQSPDSIKCVQRGVAQGALAPDVPDAPVQVQTNLSLEVVAQPAPTTATSPAQPARPTLPTPSPNVAQPENGEVAQPDGNEFAQPSQ